jgi:hypothetical protein
MAKANPKSKRKRTEAELKEDRRIKHGGYSSQVRQRFSDERTVEGKQLKVTMGDLVSDLGGNEALTADQRANLDSFRSVLIVLRRIGEYVDRQDSIIKEGQLLPVLGKNFLAYINTSRLLLKDLRESRQEGKGPDLKDYISEKYGVDSE